MTNALPEHFPTISIDREYSTHVDNMEIDIDFIVQRLKDADISDEDIDRLHIHFTHPSKKELKCFDKEGIHTSGRYLPKEERIEMLSIPEMQLIQRIYSEARSTKESRQTPDVNAWIPEATNRHVSSEVSETLNHELEHFIAQRDDDLQQQERDYRRKMSPKLIDGLSLAYFGTIGSGTALEYGAGIDHAFEISGVIAITALLGFRRRTKRAQILKYRNIYHNKPGEIRAREAEKSAPNDLVRVMMTTTEQEGSPRTDAVRSV